MILTLKTIKGDIFKYFDFAYFGRFLLILLSLYFVNTFFIGLSIPGGLYSQVFYDHYNYILWISNVILHGSKFITQLFGYDTEVTNIKMLGVVNGHRLIMQYQCVGLGLMSFWLAFIISHYKTSWKSRIKWAIGGVLAICFINSWRVAILLIALQDKWEGIRQADHHEMFNIAAYALIIGMMYLYYKTGSEKKVKSLKS